VEPLAELPMPGDEPDDEPEPLIAPPDPDVPAEPVVLLPGWPLGDDEDAMPPLAPDPLAALFSRGWLVVWSRQWVWGETLAAPFDAPPVPDPVCAVAAIAQPPTNAVANRIVFSLMRALPDAPPVRARP
jgi:hypothetical protein